MTSKTRIFVDPKAKTVIHAIEEQSRSFDRVRQGLPPQTCIHTVRKSNLIPGNNVQGKGEETLATFLDEGDYEEVTPDQLVVRKKYSDVELNILAARLLDHLGIDGSQKVNELARLLTGLENGDYPVEPGLQSESQDAENIAPEILAIMDSTIVDGVRDFDEQDIPDWRLRDQFLAKLCVKVIRALKKVDVEVSNEIIKLKISERLTVQ